MKVAVVILNWNGADMMRRFLPSVVSNSCKTHAQTQVSASSEPEDSVQVIVADNGSTDDSLRMLASEFPDVRVIALDRNYGFAEGYNRALAQVDAEYFLLLNSDIEIRQKDWLAPMVDYLDSHQDVAACQPKLYKFGTENQFEYAGAAGGFIDRYGYPYCRGRIMSVVESDHGQYDEIVPLHWATGAALMVRSHVFQELGGLDARFFAHMEEIDFCWRMRLAGHKIVCVPQSTAYHLGGATLNQGNPRKTFLNFRNNLLMLYKNLPDSDLQHVMRIRNLLDILAAVQFLVKADFQNAKAVFRAHREFRKLRPDYADVRAKLQQSRTAPSSDRTNISILWQFYVRRHSHFSNLKSPQE